MLTRCRPLLGTFVEITVPRSAASAVDAAFAAVAHVQQRMSFREADSDLGKLRKAKPGTVVEIAPDTVDVLRIALELYRQSQGLFDVTIGRELVRGGFLPRPHGSWFARWSGARWSGTSADIEIIGDSQVCCHRPMLIDLGGIAKGHAVDKAVQALQAAGAPVGMVNAGGDLRMFGDRHWEITLRDGDGMLRGSVCLANCAVASSANLANRRKWLGRTNTPHIGFHRRPVVLDGRITAVADRCIIADAMTKVAMTDRALAEELLARHDGYVLTETAQDKAA